MAPLRSGCIRMLDDVVHFDEVRFSLPMSIAVGESESADFASVGGPIGLYAKLSGELAALISCDMSFRCSTFRHVRILI